MEIYRYPSRDQWPHICRRALAEQSKQVEDTVAAIINDVATRGEQAVLDYEHRFTGSHIQSLRVTDRELEQAMRDVPQELIQAIEAAAANIERFHAAQRMQPIVVETAPGVHCEQRQLPINTVGLYIPGGNSPLFSTVLMLAVPARLAGCKRVVLCTPADSEGHVHPAILAAASIVGVTEIYKTGGAQAIAAMAIGTKEIPRVDKIFGPGNRFVMEAKQQATRLGVAIDMPAGPSEVMVLADDGARLECIAADFLSQAEHGPDSQSILITCSPSVIDALPAVIDQQASTLPKRELVEKSLSHSRLILVKDEDEMMALANDYAPEHLIVAMANWQELKDRVENAGSVFLGYDTPESAGDYASGTNHTLPTSGYARAYSGVNLDSFMKKVTFQHLTPQGVASIARTVELMAQAEGLDAHARAMTLRG